MWARGNAAIKILRADLAEKYGQEVADDLVPDANGGVQLLKLRSAMHDTCNTANAVVPKLAEKKEASGKAFYGDTRSDKGTTPQSEKPKQRKRK